MSGIVALGVFDQGEINGQSVLGAITIYLQLGFIFLFIYGSIASFGSAPLFAQGTDGTRAIRAYFSYITLATVGYGDYTPGTPVTRVAAVAEALSGQLYLVTVIAVLVSRMRPKRRSETELGQPGDAVAQQRGGEQHDDHGGDRHHVLLEERPARARAFARPSRARRAAR